jgi:hypothetical protein
VQPGLDDGQTFVFWGRNYNTAGIPGPERSVTWVNQPEKMHGSREGTGYKPGQARFANAVYIYRPDFSGPYREGVIDESDDHVTFEFYSPYIIAATPADDSPWGVYQASCRNGLVLQGFANCVVEISVDQGKSWYNAGRFRDRLDLTDHVKGHRQYCLRLGAGATKLAGSKLSVTTVCQVSSSVLPRLRDGGTRVSFAASGTAIVSAGPNLRQAEPHIVSGAFDTPRVTLDLKTPRGEPTVGVYAAAHVLSGNPPDPNVKYQIDLSTDTGHTWKAIVRDWSITRRGDEPADFWSQCLCWGSVDIQRPSVGSVQVRFRNDGGKNYARAEAHLVYQTTSPDSTKVTFAWTDDGGPHEASHVFAPSTASADDKPAWDIPTATNVRTRWIEFEPVNAAK